MGSFSQPIESKTSFLLFCFPTPLFGLPKIDIPWTEAFVADDHGNELGVGDIPILDLPSFREGCSTTPIEYYSCWLDNKHIMHNFRFKEEGVTIGCSTIAINSNLDDMKARMGMVWLALSISSTTK